MKKQTKKYTSIVMLLTIIMNLLCNTLSTGIVYAEPNSTMIMIVNGQVINTNQIVTLKTGDKVEFKLTYSSDENNQENDEFNFSVPNTFKDLNVIDYSKQHFKECIKEDNNVTLIAGPDSNTTLDGYLKISATVGEVTEEVPGQIIEDFTGEAIDVLVSPLNSIDRPNEATVTSDETKSQTEAETVTSDKVKPQTESETVTSDKAKPQTESDIVRPKQELIMKDENDTSTNNYPGFFGGSRVYKYDDKNKNGEIDCNDDAVEGFKFKLDFYNGNGEVIGSSEATTNKEGYFVVEEVNGVYDFIQQNVSPSYPFPISGNVNPIRIYPVDNQGFENIKIIEDDKLSGNRDQKRFKLIDVDNDGTYDYVEYKYTAIYHNILGAMNTNEVYVSANDDPHLNKKQINYKKNTEAAFEIKIEEIKSGKNKITVSVYKSGTVGVGEPIVSSSEMSSELTTPDALVLFMRTHKKEYIENGDAILETSKLRITDLNLNGTDLNGSDSDDIFLEDGKPHQFVIKHDDIYPSDGSNTLTLTGKYQMDWQKYNTTTDEDITGTWRPSKQPAFYIKGVQHHNIAFLGNKNESLIPKGSVELTKLDKDNKNAVIKGAKFQLLASDKTTVVKDNLETNELGKITVDHLKPGTYYFQETEAAPGYELNTELKEVVVSSGSTDTVSVTFENERKTGSVELIKVEDGNESTTIKGAKFQLLASDKTTVVKDNLETNDVGKITVDHLKPGTYYFKEIKAAPGYELSTELKEVIVEFNPTDIQTVTFTNVKQVYQFEALKVDGDTNSPLQNVTFELFKLNESKLFNFIPLGKSTETFIKKLTTDSEGKISSIVEEPGNYILREVSAPSGYAPIEDITFEIKEDDLGTVVELSTINNYLRKPIDVQLEATKKLTGKDLEADMFSFQLVDSNGNPIKNAKNNSEGKIIFDLEDFTTIGEYKYQIVEVNDHQGGIIYDSQPIDVTVTVVDGENGQLVATVTYGEKKEFNNSYKAGSTSAAIKGTKTLTGKNLEADMFEFELLNSEGTVIDTVRNTLDGKVNFGAITYDEVGTHTYTVREVKGNLSGISYDEATFEVIVNVTDDGKGNLVATVVYPDGEVAFNNSYIAAPTTAAIKGTKSLTGKNLEADMFEFQLLNSEGTVIDTVRNTLDGKVNFEAITYDKVGTHKYTAREAKGNLGGINYDEATFEAKVNVIDNGEGNLVATVAYPDGEVAFNNSYTAAPTTAVIQGTKTLTGKNLEADMFEFELLNSEGTVIDTVRNTLDGKVNFGAITYDEVGTHTYTVREVKGNLGGISYDEAIFEVTVNVTDDGKGNLVATVVYPDGGITFNNSYKAQETNATFQAIKTLIGKPLVADMFSFQLINPTNGEVLQVVKNDADGNITFESILYDEIGTYNYQIIEVDDGKDGIIYDSQPVDITVTVTDNGNGQLEAEVSYPSKQPTFTNSYQTGSTSATTSAAIEATKVLEGADLEAGMFTFELLNKDGDILETVKNSIDGKVNFKAISYDQVGTYEYQIREVKDTLDGIIYDEKIHDVTVIVTDDGNDSLVANVIYPEGGVVFKNTAVKGTLEFTKTDVATGEVIEGAHIKITCTKGLDIGKVIEFVSSKKGNKFELKAGMYTFEEIMAPEGYELTTEVGTFEIKENGEVVKANLTNKKIADQTPIDPSKPDVDKPTAQPDLTSPSTGDIGVVGYSIIGVGAAILMRVINKKKTKKKK